MKHLKKLLLIPTLLLPYYLVFNFVIIFFSAWSPVCAELEETLFQSSIVFNVQWLVVFVCVAFITATIYLILALRSNDIKDLTRNTMLVKLIQTPAYVAIFVMGIIAFLGMIFTIALVPVYFIFDCLAVCLTGIVSLPGSIKGLRKIEAKGLWIPCAILEFFMCIDVVACVVQFVMSLNIKEEIPTVNDIPAQA